MNRAVKLVKTIRNNWKKSAFALCVVAYGVDYGVQKIRTDEMMRAYCEEALRFGERTIPLEERPRHVTVILNPAAKKKKAKAQFEKFCAPLLNLAGLSVSIVQTDSEGQARGLMEVMADTDAVAVAGGDGTLSEAVTGLLRRQDAGSAAERLPLAVLPLGRTNLVAASLFGRDDNEARALAEATMALIRGARRTIDVMRIEALDSETEVKPVFAVAEVEWGAYRDVHVRRDKYWLWGGWRGRAAPIFCWPKSQISWECQAELSFVAPCAGCRRCRGLHLRPAEPAPQHSGRWWQAFVPRPAQPRLPDYASVDNPLCGELTTRTVNTVDLSVATVNARPAGQHDSSSVPAMTVSIGPSVQQLGFQDFVKEAWARDEGEVRTTPSVLAREVWLRPVMTEVKSEVKSESEDKSQEEGQWLSIDQENFELKPMHLTLLPKSVHVFCPATS